VTNIDINTYVINKQINPKLYLTRGQVYHFDVHAPANPFWLKWVSVIGRVGELNSNTQNMQYVTNNGFDVGVVTLNLTANFPASVIYYVCEFHPAMVGVISIGSASLPPSPPSSASTFGPSVFILLLSVLLAKFL